ncbi:MAG: (Fe-S)-binding protein, partial [Bacteroidales bacterium]|nr:(Fe-S)-binding protein [Bacteroidales bacterium]
VMDRMAKLALWCIFPARLLAESATSAIYHNGGFLTQACGNGLAAIGFTAPEFEYSCWMFYSLALGVFFALMPFTRYMHIFTEVFLIYFRQLGVREHAVHKTGYTMFQLSACSRCGICIDHCPLNSELGNANVQGVYMLRSIRNLELQHQQDTIAEDCLLCGRCEADCPVNIDLNAIRREVRIKNKRAFDTSGNYDYLDNVHSFNAIGRIVYFGGCMSHLTPGITEAMQKIFETAGQKYWYMDEDRSICCGRPLLQQGFTNQASDLRKKNTDLIASSGATALITSCPICYRSFKEEYKLNIPVYHHTEYIHGLMQAGKLAVRNSGQRMTYHDPCELGRGSGIYDQPRHILRSAGILLKTKNERENSLCCGFNLNDLAIDANQKRAIRDAALHNLKVPHPNVIATSCPACKKAFTRAESFPVKDVAEIVAENMVVKNDA